MRTICVDFDGVLNTYTGWAGEDELFEPRKGAKSFIRLLVHEHKVVIFTARNTVKVEEWLNKYGFPYDEVTNVKPPAMVYLDDRAVNFKGEFNDDLLREVLGFRAHWENEEDYSDTDLEALYIEGKKII